MEEEESKSEMSEPEMKEETNSNDNSKEKTQDEKKTNWAKRIGIIAGVVAIIGGILGVCWMAFQFGKEIGANDGQSNLIEMQRERNTAIDSLSYYKRLSSEKQWFIEEQDSILESMLKISAIDTLINYPIYDNSYFSARTDNSTFQPPIISQGFIKIASFDKLEEEFFGVSIIPSEKLHRESIEGLSGRIKIKKGSLIYRSKPKSSQDEFNFSARDIQIVDEELSVELVSRITSNEELGVVQYWAKIKQL